MPMESPGDTSKHEVGWGENVHAFYSLHFPTEAVKNGCGKEGFLKEAGFAWSLEVGYAMVERMEQGERPHCPFTGLR